MHVVTVLGGFSSAKDHLLLIGYKNRKYLKLVPSRPPLLVIAGSLCADGSVTIDLIS